MAEEQPGALILVENVSKLVSTQQGDDVILDGVSFAVPRGGQLCIAGPRGSGKSTLLRLLAALDRPTSGTISIAGISLNRLSDDEANRWRGRAVGMVLAHPNLFDTLSVEENLLLALDVGKALPKGRRRERAHECLEAVDMVANARRFPAELSLDERWRVAIARARVNRPMMILMDEPAEGLVREAASGETTVVYSACDSRLPRPKGTRAPGDLRSSAPTEHVCLVGGRVVERSYGAIPGMYE